MDLDLYIDVIFFVNFFMDLLLLMLLKGIMKRAVSRKRLVLAAAFGGIFGCLEAFGWKIPGGLLALGSLLGAWAMVFAAFGRSGGWGELAKGTGILFLLAMLAGGAMEFLLKFTRAGFYFLNVLLGRDVYVIPLFGWVFLAAGTFFFVRGLWQFGEQARGERKNRYPLILTDGAVTAKATGYLDTGNCLQEPASREGVHIVTERIWKLFEDSGGERAMIPYHTIGNPYGVMEGVRIERMEIMQCGGNIKINAPWIARAPYGLSKQGGYEVLLYGETTIREDKEGGTTNGH